MGSTIEFRAATFDTVVLHVEPVPERLDTSLVAAAQTGDTSAFGCLYARYCRIVHAILLAKVPPSEVDDLVHDVFLRAFTRLSDLRDASRFGPWLSAIARNISNDFHRQSRPQVEVNEDFSGDEVKDGVPAAADDRVALAALEAIRSLPETYRNTLFLRLVEGMTGPEIALRTGLTHGSVRVNLHRGMQLLREKLGDSALSTKRRDSGSCAR